MATTDTKPGFRLPWSSERGESANTNDVAADQGAEVLADTASEHEAPDMTDASPAATDQPAAVEAQEGPGSSPDADVAGALEPAPDAPAAASPAPMPGRKPNKFMADLTRAMQVAAEAAREETQARFAAEAKTHIESIHADSANDAVELRKRADDDVAAIREWSKAEIARIREETDERIAHRKSTLENEIGDHAASIEARVERVQSRVDAFETEMAAFFERLLAEDDPTRFATMAESLPEPPPFDGPAHQPTIATLVAPVDETLEALDAPVGAEDAEGADAGSAGATPDAEAESVAEAVAETSDQPEAAADTPVEAVEESTEGAGSTDTAEPGGEPDEQPTADAEDPRLSALRQASDFASAEAGSESFTPGEAGADDDIPEISDDAIAARLAGLVHEDATPATVATTRVTVTGLISVASIAGFKRQLSRSTGVTSVGVSSGPDGEFVFAVGHAPDVAVRDIVPTLSGFAARVTEESDGALTVAARDPEAEG